MQKEKQQKKRKRRPKQIGLIWALWLLVSVAAEAQPRWYVGLRGGLNIAGVNIRDQFRPVPIRTRTRKGKKRGWLLRYYFPVNEDKLVTALQIEVLHAEKGYRQDFEKEEDPPFINHMDYVEVPLITHLSYVLGKYQVFGNVGFFYEQLVRLHQEVPEKIPEKQEIYQFLYESDRKKGFGICFGIGGGRELLGGKMEAELGLSQSLRDHIRDNRLLSQRPMQSKLNAWFLSLNYVYPLSFRFKRSSS